VNKELAADEKQQVKRLKPDLAAKEVEKQQPAGPGPDTAGLMRLQQQVGNRAVQRLLAQRSGEGAFELDDDTTTRINQARGGGQALDSSVQEQMSANMGHDFSGVRVHTSSEADQLNQQLSAKAFTTGQDIFFRQGAYDPGSSGGQELIAHELTHVVQQGSGQVSSGGGGMTVNAPDDAYEQEADTVAKQAVNTSNEAGSQADVAGVQREGAPEEEELQTKAIQREGMPEEEEELQTKAIQREGVPEEEELQTKAIQREGMPEEEELQTKAIQREGVPEEEELQTKAIQREGMPEEEEELQTKAIQREGVPEEEELKV
jgi:hypothetical protein